MHDQQLLVCSMIGAIKSVSESHASRCLQVLGIAPAEDSKLSRCLATNETRLQKTSWHCHGMFSATEDLEAGEA